MGPDGALKSGMLKGLIGFQELETTVKEKPQVGAKNSKKKAKKRKAQILFDKDEIVATVQSQQSNDKPVVQTKPKKKRTRKKKTKEESIEVKVVTNEEYQFQHKLTQWSRMNLAKPLLRILDERSLLEPTTVQA